jgi:hypothetical protein
MGGLLELWWYSKLHLAEAVAEKPESAREGLARLWSAMRTWPLSVGSEHQSPR